MALIGLGEGPTIFDPPDWQLSGTEARLPDTNSTGVSAPVWDWARLYQPFQATIANAGATASSNSKGIDVNTISKWVSTNKTFVYTTVGVLAALALFQSRR